MIAISSGLVLSPAFSWLISAPPSTSALRQSVKPWRAANCSALMPPCELISSL